MPINDDDLMSAITAGAAEAGGGPVGGADDAGENAGDDTAGSDDQAEAAADGGETPDQSGAEPAVDGGDAADAGAADVADGEAEGGKPAGAGKDAAAAAKPGDKDKSAVDPNKPAKAPDPLNDPIPNALKKETKERIQTLISTVKSTTSERDIAVAERNEIISSIESTGASPEEYGEMLGVLASLKSGDPTRLEQAYNVLFTKAQEIGRVLGKVVPGVDALADHPDLKQHVADGAMLQEHAEELAAARDARKLQSQSIQQRQQITQQQEREQAEHKKGKDELNAVGASLASDPQFMAKHAILKESLKFVFTTLPPSKWAATYKNAYEKLKLPTAAPRAAAPARPGQNQPLRGKTPAGGGVPAPSSILDAVKASLGQFPTE